MEVLSLEDTLVIDRTFNSSPEFEIGSFICFVYKNLHTYRRDGFCYGIIPPLPNVEIKKKFVSKENAGVYLIRDQLAIFSTTHNSCFAFGTVNLSEAELRELSNIVLIYKEETKRLPEHLLGPEHRRFSLKFDCDYVDMFLKMWRGTRFDDTHSSFTENGTSLLFVRHEGMKVNISDKNREDFLNRLLAQKEMVGTILLLPEYRIVTQSSTSGL